MAAGRRDLHRAFGDRLTLNKDWNAWWRFWGYSAPRQQIAHRPECGGIDQMIHILEQAFYTTSLLVAHQDQVVGIGGGMIDLALRSLRCNQGRYCAVDPAHAAIESQLTKNLAVLQGL